MDEKPFILMASFFRLLYFLTPRKSKLYLSKSIFFNFNILYFLYVVSFSFCTIIAYSNKAHLELLRNSWLDGRKKYDWKSGFYKAGNNDDLKYKTENFQMPMYIIILGLTRIYLFLVHQIRRPSPDGNNNSGHQPIILI